jgi:two-component system phosphate regulon sensor histidine kinase PhoR
MPTAAPHAAPLSSPVTPDSNEVARRRGVPVARAPRTLRGRLSLTLAGLVGVVLAMLGLYLGIAGRQLYVDRLSAQLGAQAQLVAAAVAPALTAGEGIATIDPLVKRLGNRLDSRLTIVAADGTVLGDSFADPRAMDNHARRPEVAAARAAGFGEAERTSRTLDAGFLYVAVPIPEAPGAVARIALPLTEVDAAVWRIRRDIAAAALIAAALATAVGMYIAARITGPLEDLRQQARAVAEGRLDATVRPAGDWEIGDLARAFNAMTADLRRLVAGQERSRARMEATLANLHDGVILTDDAETVIQMNDAAAEMLGATAGQAIGRPFLVVARDHELADLLRSALAEGGPRGAVVEYGRGPRLLEAAAQPFTGGGERLGLVVLRDVTELRRLEGVRREFVANVSHELRTPLTSIRAMVETLEAGARDDPSVASEFFARIVGEVDHLTALVEELLDLARLESRRVTLSREASDPVAILDRAIERLRPQAERAGLALRVEAEGTLPPVLVDRGRIEQVLINLVHNAVKFTPEGGEIVASAETTDGMLRVSIRDTGVGIAPEELPRVFERFYKTDVARRSAGSGLGLAIAKHIVQVHGGTIWAESAPGRGTTILFTLPLAPPPRQSPPPLPDSPARSRRRAGARGTRRG